MEESKAYATAVRLDKLSALIASKVPVMPKAIVLSDEDYALLRAQVPAAPAGRLTYCELLVFRKSDLLDLCDEVV